MFQFRTDHSSRPHKLPWKASEEERAIVCALRRATGFPLDDLTFVVTHFLPHLNRDAVYRILKAEGLGRLPPADRARRSHSRFKAYDLGFIHVDVKHLPKLRTADGEFRKRYLFVAIGRRSRSVHLAVEDDETEAGVKAFLRGGFHIDPGLRRADRPGGHERTREAGGQVAHAGDYQGHGTRR